jgi:hypothetical protein
VTGVVGRRAIDVRSGDQGGEALTGQGSGPSTGWGINALAGRAVA